MTVRSSLILPVYMLTPSVSAGITMGLAGLYGNGWIKVDHAFVAEPQTNGVGIRQTWPPGSVQWNIQFIVGFRTL